MICLFDVDSAGLDADLLSSLRAGGESRGFGAMGGIV